MTIDDALRNLPKSNLKPEDIAKYQAENTALLIDKQKEIEDRRAEIERKFEARRNYIFRRTMFGLVAGAFLAISSGLRLLFGKFLSASSIVILLRSYCCVNSSSFRNFLFLFMLLAV